MAKSIPQENLAVARRFFEKFGLLDSLPIDKFDMFIIDEKLAADPETDDTKSPVYKGFVSERNAAKRMLNTAGAHLNGQAFMIDVVEAGKTYTIKSWHDGTRTAAADIGNKVKDFTNNKMDHLHGQARKVQKMLALDPTNVEIKETLQMLTFMSVQGIELNSRVAGLVQTYNTAANAVEDRIAALTKEFEDAPAIEAQD